MATKRNTLADSIRAAGYEESKAMITTSVTFSHHSGNVKRGALQLLGDSLRSSPSIHAFEALTAGWKRKDKLLHDMYKKS